VTGIDQVKSTASEHLKQVEAKQGSVQYHVSVKQQGHLRCAFDRHMLPVVCTLYILSYLDRGNIGNTKIVSAQKELGLSSAQVC
jgi:hypothetical protein